MLKHRKVVQQTQTLVLTSRWRCSKQPDNAGVGNYFCSGATLRRPRLAEGRTFL